MNILITGASGLIGRTLQAYLRKKGYQVFVMHRNIHNGNNNFYWRPAEGVIHLDEKQPIDMVINLSGEPLTALRWTAAKKKRIYDSRVHTTNLLSQKLTKLTIKPSL